MKKLSTTLFLLLLANFLLFAEQVVLNEAPPFVDTVTISPSEQSTTVLADASEEDFFAELYYNNESLEEDAIISSTADNQALLLNQSWELSPFSIRITGSGLTSFNLYIDLEVGFFQLLDSNNQIAQGSEGYTVDSQAMKIQDTSTIPGIVFETLLTNSNQYKYTIPLNTGNYYSSSDMANFKLTWDAKDIPQPGNYISIIQVRFSVD